MADSPAEHNEPQVITDVLWTRRALPSEALTSGALKSGLRLHLSPTVTIGDVPAVPAMVRRFEAASPPALIVTSGEGARRLAATLLTNGPATPPAPITVLTFSREVERILSSDGRFRVQLFANAATGAELAAELIRGSDRLCREPLVFAGAEAPAFNFTAALTAEGIACEHWPLYRTEAIGEPSVALRELAAANGRRIAVALFSPSAVRGFARQWQALYGPKPQLASPTWQAVVIGPTTKAAAAAYFERIHVAREPSVAAMLACLGQLAGNSPPVTI